MKKIGLVIVDDEKNVLNSLKRLFRSETFGMFLTTDHTEAMEVLAQNPVKVVMSDQKMTKITGVEFLKTVKDKYPEVVNILFTGYADLKIATEAINKGEVYKFINKPWNDEELKSAVREALNKYDLEEKNRSLTENVKKQNKKLKKLYEAQKDFTLMVSHELRTPLAAMRMAVDFVMKESAGGINAKQKDLLGKASNSAGRLNRIIDDILEFSRLEFDVIHIKVRPNRIDKLIEEVVLSQEPVARGKGIDIKTEPDRGIGKVSFDRDRITQVLNNLINNAIKFTTSGGVTIKCKVDKSAGKVIVSVIDTGIGIHKENIPELFKKFKRFADVSKNREKGTGVGLAICKAIIDQHGGRIWAESKFGSGSSFHFSLAIKL